MITLDAEKIITLNGIQRYARIQIMNEFKKGVNKNYANPRCIRLN